jgi:hypothetical protein
MWSEVDRYIAGKLIGLEGPFDLIFTDADKRSNAEYLRDPSVQGCARSSTPWPPSPECAATAIQTVGAKGYDGFALALVGG